MYRTITVVRDASEAVEPLGTKAKFWYGGHMFLFKAARRNTGEDWAELVCAVITERLGLPHAEYQLAQWEGAGHTDEAFGVSSKNFLPDGARLILGNELSGQAEPEYGKANVSRFRVRDHTVERVIEAIRGIAAGIPPGWAAPAGITDAVQVFIGYLALDALVGNTDRHNENWGVIRMSEGAVHLAPTFDHASSLGCHLRDVERRDWLHKTDQNRTVSAFAVRGRSALYRTPADAKPLFTGEAFREAARFDSWAGVHWLNAIERLGQAEIVTILGNVPSDRMSGEAAEFAERLLLINKNRLLELKKAFS